MNRKRALLAGAVGLALALTGLTSAAPQAESGLIAFVDENGELHTVAADGRGYRRVTKSGTVKLSPAWSPDGRQLAFVTQVGAFDEVFVVNRDGAGLGRVTRGAHAYGVTWAPDGAHLLVSLFSAKGRDGLALVDVRERPRARLQRLAGTRDRAAAVYSPDGHSIAFQQGRSIYTARIDDLVLTAVRRVARGETARWMAGGAELAILQSDAIRAFPLRGGRPRILLGNPGTVGPFDIEPGGRRLVFEDLVERGRSDVPHIFVTQIGGANRRDLTGARLEATEPAWQPTRPQSE